jgi:hypothetical protein
MRQDDNRVVAEFRERRRDDPTTLEKGQLPELDAGETTATCSACGYFGIVDDDPVIANADQPETDEVLICSVCDEQAE